MFRWEWVGGRVGFVSSKCSSSSSCPYWLWISNLGRTSRPSIQDIHVFQWHTMVRLSRSCHWNNCAPLGRYINTGASLCSFYCGMNGITFHLQMSWFKERVREGRERESVEFSTLWGVNFMGVGILLLQSLGFFYLLLGSCSFHLNVLQQVQLLLLE